MRNIKAPEAWTIAHDTNIVVAVIDTGVDYTHEDLKANMWTNDAGDHGFDFVENDKDPLDEHGHGTHCSGTIGAVGNNMIASSTNDGLVGFWTKKGKSPGEVNIGSPVRAISVAWPRKALTWGASVTLLKLLA